MFKRLVVILVLALSGVSAHAQITRDVKLDQNIGLSYQNNFHQNQSLFSQGIFIGPAAKSVVFQTNENVDEDGVMLYVQFTHKPPNPKIACFSYTFSDAWAKI